MTTRSGIAGFFAMCSIVCLSAGLVLTVPLAASGQEPLKIGILDFREVALGSKAGKTAKARLEKLAEKLKKEMKVEEAKVLARRKDLEAATSRLTPAERQQRAATLDRDEATFQRLLEDKTEELKNAETESIQKLAGQIFCIPNSRRGEHKSRAGFDIPLQRVADHIKANPAKKNRA